MNERSTSVESARNAKTTLNAIVAAFLTALASWMTVADFSHHGDLLFQSSISIWIAALFVSVLFLAGIVIAALPKRLVIGVNLLLLSRCALGFPLNIWLGNTVGSRVATVAFLLLSLGYLAVSLGRMKSLASRPWMQPKHSIISTVAWLLIGFLSIPVLITGYAYGAQSLLGRYTSLSPKGVNLLETVFEKDGQRVHLVGMMHIGDGNYYSDLIKRINAVPPSGGKRLVLTEGVSDRNQIIPEDFANGTTYERWAKQLGLETQKDLSSPTPDGEPTPDASPRITWQNADIDVSDLQERHRKLLVEMLKLASSADLSQMFSADAANISGEQFEDLLMNGLIISRNDTLMKRFAEAGDGYEEIYIPWGAAHLPDIEKRLLALGYQKAGETTRPVMRFWK